MHGRHVEGLQSGLEILRPGGFLVLDYVPSEQGDSPYAQAAMEPSGWYLEVVSGWYLPREAWPIDDLALKRAGWTSPPAEGDNWFRYEDLQTDVEALCDLLLESHVIGRRCDGGGEFIVSTGRFPNGPDGGEPWPAPDLALAA